jgi:hypothetical protein
MQTLSADRASTSTSPVTSDDCSVLEFRQYTLQPGTRDGFVDLFEREFLESQEILGNRILGQFRDLDDPDRFVWLRGFRDMTARAEALTAFYGGPVWQTHRDTANACIIDSDNVLLLRPANGSAIVPAPRPATDAASASDGRVLATTYHFDAPVDEGFVAFFEREVAPAVTAIGASMLAHLVTEPAANNFRLPVREGEHVFVWLAGFADASMYQRYLALTRSSDWQHRIAPELRPRLLLSPEILRLAPTPRSRTQA